jgi:hypothetical protein
MLANFPDFPFSQSQRDQAAVATVRNIAAAGIAPETGCPFFRHRDGLKFVNRQKNAAVR